MARFKKSDITFHSDGYRERKPAVNVKVYDSLAQGFAKWAAVEPDHDPRFTVEWIEANLSDEAQSDYFTFACENGIEDAENDAQELWGSRLYGRDVTVYTEGRSGGWLIVDGIDIDVESWDAIAVAKWGKFARWARATADYTMARMVDMIYINRFDQWADEESERIGAEAFSPESMLFGVPTSN
jgi:hypothetical protein